MNEQIAKKLGWFSRNNVTEWYSTPDGRRLDDPPPFHLDTADVRKIWRGMKGVLETLFEMGLLGDFCEALKGRAMLARGNSQFLSVVDFGEFCLMAKPEELHAAFMAMLEEE